LYLFFPAVVVDDVRRSGFGLSEIENCTELGVAKVLVSFDSFFNLSIDKSHPFSGNGVAMRVGIGLFKGPLFYT
jgi:hypothetical protein